MDFLKNQKSYMIFWIFMEVFFFGFSFFWNLIGIDSQRVDRKDQGYIPSDQNVTKFVTFIIHFVIKMSGTKFVTF